MTKENNSNFRVIKYFSKYKIIFKLCHTFIFLSMVCRIIWLILSIKYKIKTIDVTAFIYEL
ncbi:MAG: hypothetical protein AUJ36_02160 [Parcubacteria group bacterium CG1_02_41_26]|nr:MAG: hypothetical protein AUJ36_02160 [Parcubacteria group bacterium CG1_02_41_26]